ncbi:phosphate signaling complex protein PhoU [Hahella ganghwensis]|uniref:phosphate signaling complex protein PhoU n=1 Tax=Hahella ganghwensis TaxID=286420 RepID=UPI00037700D9|nr:phosphate signaling complex protein PhoU [Hahella ganghwensis]
MAQNSDVHLQHISQQFNTELRDLRNHVLVMGGLVEKQVSDATLSLVNADSELAQLVRQTEDDIDKLEVTIDEECTRVIAKRQPTASDLRLVMGVAKMVSDLERIGDEAEKIAKIGIRLTEEGQAPRGYVEVRHISNHVGQMVHDALDAFTRFDLDLALRVMKEDKAVDTEYKSAMRSLVTFMMEDPRNITGILNIIWVLRSLERIGDHSRNICEHVIYMVKGKDVRHASLEKAEQIIEDKR